MQQIDGVVIIRNCSTPQRGVYTKQSIAALYDVWMQRNYTNVMRCRYLHIVEQKKRRNNY